MSVSLAKYKTIDFSKPLSANYLSRGWLDPDDEHKVKPELIGEWAMSKAYEFANAKLPADAFIGLFNHLQRLAFGVPAGTSAAFSEQEWTVIEASIADAASAHRLLREWVTTQALPNIHDRIELQSFTAHVQAVKNKLAEIEFARKATEQERVQAQARADGGLS